jgi:hypothetical protein
MQNKHNAWSNSKCESNQQSMSNESVCEYEDANDACLSVIEDRMWEVICNEIQYKRQGTM